MSALQELGGGREDKVGDTGVRLQGGRRQVGQDVDDTNLGHEVWDFCIRSSGHSLFVKACGQGWLWTKFHDQIIIDYGVNKIDIFVPTPDIKCILDCFVKA